MHKLLTRQIRSLAPAATQGEQDQAALLAVVNRTYEEFDRERRLNYRAAQLTEDELKIANAKANERHATILSAIVGNVPDAVLILSSAGDVESSNVAAEQIFGERGTLPAHCNVSALILDLERQPISLKDTHLSEALGRSVDGREFPLEYSLAAFEGEVGPRQLMIARDISKRKQREVELTEAKETAESANRMKSEFLAMMSHELRTPLNAILGFSEIIRDETMGTGSVAWARYREYAELTHDSGRHLLALICDILDLSKIEAGNYNLDLRPIDLRVIVGDCVAIISPLADKKTVSVNGVDSFPSIWVDGDQRALKQVLLNLLSNAVKFTAPGGDVRLHAETNGSSIAISVTDTGIGIAEEQLETVFEPFRQLDSGTARRYEGTGLGLTISRRLIELHGGEIELESKVGGGTRALVRLRQRTIEPLHVAS